MDIARLITFPFIKKEKFWLIIKVSVGASISTLILAGASILFRRVYHAGW